MLYLSETLKIASPSIECYHIPPTRIHFENLNEKLQFLSVVKKTKYILKTIKEYLTMHEDQKQVKELDWRERSQINFLRINC